MDIEKYLRFMVSHEASDLFLSSGAPANLKIEGQTKRIGEEPLQSAEVQELAYSVMNEDQRKVFERELEMNLAYSVTGLGRFRINIYRQRGAFAMVIRFIKNEIPTIEDLHLPPILKQLVMEPRGLILVVGSTGSGKSTTLASMIDYRAARKTGHILTIEDPIEYMHHHQKSIIDQRELGFDTLSYANALTNAMREAPDVILIGEIRDRDTMQHAIAYADTGHLCLSTLHANNANQTIERIINFFPDTAHRQLYSDLSLNLKAVISQRLIRRKDGRRVPAMEVMLNSPYISKLIDEGKIEAIKDAMKEAKMDGMQTFDESLYNLYADGSISLEDALDNADSRSNLKLAISLGHAPDDNVDFQSLD